MMIHSSKKLINLKILTGEHDAQTDKAALWIRPQCECRMHKETAYSSSQ